MKACANQCIGCDGQLDTCKNCRGNRLEAPLCYCEDSFYDDFISENCLKC